jgi:hypothetical protein
MFEVVGVVVEGGYGRVVDGGVAGEGSGGKEVDVSVCVKAKNSRR